MNYKNIERAHLEIAYDNGGINRGRSEGEALNELRHWLHDYWSHDALEAIDDWLGMLSNEQLNALCCGDEVDQAELNPPVIVNTLLTEIFDNVC